MDRPPNSPQPPHPSEEAPGAHAERWAGRLLQRTCCPHCWQLFEPVETLFVARHDDLLGDPVAGPEEHLRFRPTRFTPEGLALDPGGMECREMACPRCHLPVPRALLEMPPFTVSVVGAPASGKSYFLSALTWQLRRLMPRLGWTLADADPAANAVLHRNEELLFLPDDPERPVFLEKTQPEGGELYRTVRIEGQSVTLPTPFQFTLTPKQRPAEAGRLLVLYDNAGEHFLPGHESARNPLTDHLARASVIMFMLDPSQDPRIRARVGVDDPQVAAGSRQGMARQETVLSEAIQRVRRARGLSAGAKHHAPLVITLAKADIWEKLLPEPLSDNPITPGAEGGQVFDVDAVRRMSRACRALLDETCPEVVALAESFARRVVYVPVSSLGRSPEVVRTGTGEFLGVRPSQIRPKWVGVPLIAAIHAVEPELLPAVSSESAADGAAA